MKYYITINENNEITGRYIDSIHKEIPKNSIEVSETLWKQRLNDSSLNCYENGKLVKKDFTTDEQREKQRVQQIESKQDEIITKRDMYPIHKQLNIDNQLYPYTLEDKEIKNMFIETVRLIGRKAKENGTLVDDIDWAGLDEITEPSQITQDLLLQAKKLLG